MVALARLDKIVELLATFDGITRKFVLPSIIGKVRRDSFKGDTPHGMGEDSAAIGTNSDEFVLLTTDAIVEELCLNSPRAAGFNVVLANVMDIYAAGGNPTSFAVAISYADPTVGEAMMAGLIDGSHTFQIPIVRGHTNSRSTSTYIVGSATGTAHKSNLLTAGGAMDGDALVLIFDQEGQRGSSYELGWDSVTDRPSEEVVKRLSVMNTLARANMIHASKDVSVAGMVGTAGMMLEYSGRGGCLDLDMIESVCPDAVDLEDWLRMFVSLGFLVSVAPDNLQRLQHIVTEHGLVAARIGCVDDSSKLCLRLGTEARVLFDFSSGPVLTPRN